MLSRDGARDAEEKNDACRLVKPVCVVHAAGSEGGNEGEGEGGRVAAIAWSGWVRSPDAEEGRAQDGRGKVMG